MVSTQVTLTDEQAEGLQRLAQIRGLSVPDYISRVLEEALQREADDCRARWERAVAFVGRYASSDGRSASEEHDEMLAEAYEHVTPPLAGHDHPVTSSAANRPARAVSRDGTH